VTPRLAHPRRGERAFERLYRRRVGDVYRYAVLLLLDPLAAEEVTRTTFLSAHRATDGIKQHESSLQAWLLGLAHAECRRRSPHADLDDDPALQAVPDVSCSNLSAVSRLIDGRLPRLERSVLQFHVRACDDCSAFARSQERQRAAWSALGTLALPTSLGSFFGPGGILASASESGGTVDGATAAPTTPG